VTAIWIRCGEIVAADGPDMPVSFHGPCGLLMAGEELPLECPACELSGRLQAVEREHETPLASGFGGRLDGLQKQVDALQERVRVLDANLDRSP